MKITNKGRKGATLAELMIVIAVLAIAATMVTSFSSMLHGAQGISNARYQAMQDVKVAESLIEGFIENNHTTATIGEYKDNRLAFEATWNNDKYESGKFVWFTRGLLVINNGEGSSTLELESLDSIGFSVVTDDNNRDTLYYCTITYLINDQPYTYTFCVNPYVGENIS